MIAIPCSILAIENEDDRSFMEYVFKAYQKLKKNGVWQTIKSWSDSGRAFSIVKNYYVLHGYDYRALLTVRVYDSKNTLIETGSTSSNTYYY